MKILEMGFFKTIVSRWSFDVLGEKMENLITQGTQMFVHMDLVDVTMRPAHEVCCATAGEIGSARMGCGSGGWAAFPSAL